MVVSNFLNANFGAATINKADMRSSDFVYANMFGVDMSQGPTTLGRINAFFGRTNFTRTDFRKANLANLDIRGDWIVGAGTCHTLMPDGHENNYNC